MTDVVIHKEEPTPRFDVKVALTTRGWSWELEVKDCPDGTTASKLMEEARVAVHEQMMKEYPQGGGT